MKRDLEDIGRGAQTSLGKWEEADHTPLPPDAGYKQAGLPLEPQNGLG